MAELDITQDRADHDAADTAIERLTERQQWIVYCALWARGFRIDSAQHVIAKLAPRRAA